MRLLKITGPGEFSLVQAATHNTLPYAILSHTWVNGQEFTYTDLISGTGEKKTGYEKIKFCGERAMKDGLQYFWVDTCCINKSNSTELSTAINSMFRWYRNAKKCYVYLADVSTPGYNATPGYDTDVQAEQNTWEAAFRESKWFTRGWTLQELIAPAIVEFFSKEGKRLGNKNSLEKLIYDVTRIPIQALQGNPFSHFSIAERKEWAARRQTTEEEDIVYCLLGLCEVSMPPIYGEGKEAAQKRLQITVREFSKDTSEPEDLEDYTAPFIVPFDRNPNFTGRVTELARVEEKIFRGSQTTKVAIWGLGGVGKTQLLLELVYRTKDKYKNCSVIWIPATNMENLYKTYLDVAQLLGIPAREDKEADVKKLVQEYLSNDNAGQWLLVFDNADDIDMWIAKPGSGYGAAQESGGLIDYLPRSKQGSIVFTTRDRKAAVKLAQENIVEVREMNEELSVLLLQKCLANPDLVKDEQETTALLKELTNLPLAIVQAAAYINENGISLAEYILLLEQQEEEVIDLLSEEFQDFGRYRNLKNPVATTWLISFEKIRRCDTLAAEYLSFMCCIDPKDIPQSLLPPGPSRKKEIEAIGTLNAYSFITKRPDLALDLHRLVHLSMRNWLRKEKVLAHSTEAVIRRLKEVFPDEDHKNRNLWRMYLPHARYALESHLVKKDSESRMNLMWKYGMCLFEDGRGNEAEPAITEVFEIEKRDLGADHPSTLTRAIKLAWTFLYQGRYKEAEELGVQAKEACLRVLGQEHLDTLDIMSNLAWTYRNQGRHNEAEQLGVQVLEIRKRVLGQEHPDTLASIANLASTFWNQGRYKEAEELEVQVLEASKRVLGQEHPDTLASIANLASTFWNQGRYKEAEELQVQVLETSKRVLGQEHPDTLASIANLALTFRNQGRYKEAEEVQVQVLETSKRVLGQEHPDTLNSIASLALTFRNQGRYKEAEELQVQVLETEKRVLGQEHPDTLASIANLASTFWNQGLYKEAEELEVQVLETRKRVLGQEHPDTLASIANLASTFWNQGRYKEAEEVQVQVLETSKRVLGQEHPDTLNSIASLALTFQNQGRYKEAEELQVQVLETRKRVLGQEHPDTLFSMANLAYTWKVMGRETQAVRLMEESIQLRKRVLGLDHPHTLSCCTDLARWKAEQADSGRAVSNCA